MKFIFEQTVNAPIETVFRFHENPANLALLLNNWPSSRIVSHGADIRPGAETVIRQTVAGLAHVKMRFRHNVYEPPNRFGEEMIQGPFRQFAHLHEFERANHSGGKGDGGGEKTLIRDRLTIELPWHLGGELAMRLFAQRSIRKFFDYRRQALEELVRSGRLAELAAGLKRPTNDAP